MTGWLIGWHLKSEGKTVHAGGMMGEKICRAKCCPLERRRLTFWPQHFHPVKHRKQTVSCNYTVSAFSGWWFGTEHLLFFHILEYSSQLTSIFFRGIGIPPSRFCICIGFPDPNWTVSSRGRQHSGWIWLDWERQSREIFFQLILAQNWWEMIVWNYGIFSMIIMILQGFKPRRLEQREWSTKNLKNDLQRLFLVQQCAFATCFFFPFWSVWFSMLAIPICALSESVSPWIHQYFPESANTWCEKPWILEENYGKLPVDRKKTKISLQIIFIYIIYYNICNYIYYIDNI